MTVVPGFTIVHTLPLEAVALLLHHERTLTNHLIGVMGVVRPKTHPQLALWVRGLYTVNTTMVARLEGASATISADGDEFKDVVNQFLVTVGGDAMVLYDKVSHDDLPQVAPVVAHLSHYVQFITTALRICRNPFVGDRLAELKQRCQSILHQHHRQQAMRKMNAIRFDLIQLFGTLERNHVLLYFRIDDIVHRLGHALVNMVDFHAADVPVELLLLNLNAQTTQTLTLAAPAAPTAPAALTPAALASLTSTTTNNNNNADGVAYNALAIVRVDGAHRQLAFPPFRTNEVTIARKDGVLTLTAVDYGGASASARAQVRLALERDDLLASWFTKLAKIFPQRDRPIVADAGAATSSPPQEMLGLGIGFVSAPGPALAPTPPPTPPLHPAPTPEFYELYDTPLPLRPTLDDLSPNVSLDSLALPVPPAPRKRKPLTPALLVYTAQSPCEAPAARLAAGQQRRPAPVLVPAPALAPRAAEFAYTPELLAPLSELDDIDTKPVALLLVMKLLIYKLPGGLEVDIANFGAGHVPNFTAATTTTVAPLPPRRRKLFFSLFRNPLKVSVHDDANGSNLTLGSAKTITSTSFPPVNGITKNGSNKSINGYAAASTKSGSIGSASSTNTSTSNANVTNATASTNTVTATNANTTVAKSTSVTAKQAGGGGTTLGAPVVAAPTRAAPPPPPPTPPKTPMEAKEPTNVTVFSTPKHTLTVKQLTDDWSRLFHGDATIKFVVNNAINKGWVFIDGERQVIEVTTALTVRLANPRELHVHGRVIGATEPLLVLITTCKAPACHVKLSDWLCEADLVKDYSLMLLLTLLVLLLPSDNHSAPASKLSTLTLISTYGLLVAGGVGLGYHKKPRLPAVAETRPLLAHEAAGILRDPLNDRLLVLLNMKIRMLVQTKGYTSIQDPQLWTITGMYLLTLYAVSEARTLGDYLQFVLKGLDGDDEVSWMIAAADKKYTLEPIGRAGLLVKCLTDEIYMLECKGRKEYAKLSSLL